MWEWSGHYIGLAWENAVNKCEWPEVIACQTFNQARLILYKEGYRARKYKCETEYLVYRK